MIFNGIEKDYVAILRGRNRPFFMVGEKRELVIPILILYESISHYERLKEDISLWLKHDEAKPLTFKDDSERVYFAITESINEVDIYPRGAEATITFHCESKYSLEKSIQSGGTHIIQGHESTFWRTHTEFTSNVTGYELAFTPVGKSELKDINKIVLNGDFRSGDILEIDYRKRRVTLNNKDISNQLVIVQSNYKELDIGSVEISSSVPTTVYYHERYY